MELTTIIPLLLGAIGLVIGLVALRSVLAARGIRRGRVERQLMNALEVPPVERKVLRRMARVAGLPDAAGLLLSRGCFDRAARLAGVSSGADLERLRHRLHGSP